MLYLQDYFISFACVYSPSFMHEIIFKTLQKGQFHGMYSNFNSMIHIFFFYSMAIAIFVKSIYYFLHVCLFLVFKRKMFIFVQKVFYSLYFLAGMAISPKRLRILDFKRLLELPKYKSKIECATKINKNGLTQECNKRSTNCSHHHSRNVFLYFKL